MSDVVKTMKLRLYTDKRQGSLLAELSLRYSEACNYISEYIFNNGFPLNSIRLQELLYQDLRARFGLKAQMAISSIKTTTARYKTVCEQMKQNPYRFPDKEGKWHSIPRSLEWLWKPVVFSRPQADLVRGRDYSFVENGTLLSLNTLQERIKVKFATPAYFVKYFDGMWKFGAGKIISLNGIWYFHIPMTKTQDKEPDCAAPKHVVGIDRGLRFLATTYDESGNVHFIDGKAIMHKRDKFQHLRDELQSRGTKSAKRMLKRISGRENRWMSDVNHRISKALVQEYGEGTLFVLEDLTGVTFDEELLSHRRKKQRHQTRSWAFYQLEQFLSYKANAMGSAVIKVDADYTSQRCPKCGRIHKGNRNHHKHEYVCDSCGYRSNDDRIGAMNIYALGTMYVSGDTNPRFGSRREN